jgi:hypothetical protein
LYVPAERDWIELESGLQVQFTAGTYKSHDFWLIPARAASADAQSGTLEWPLDAAGKPLLQAPAGIRHHYCRLAVLRFDGAKITSVDDCRNLFPPLANLTTLVYVGGDGQEAMPGAPLPQLLQAGVFNWRWPIRGAKVRFKLLPIGSPDAGKLAPHQGGLAAATAGAPLEVATDANGIAGCAWLLEANVKKPSQQVEARLLDAGGNELPPVLRFTANQSQADQVSYDPAKCPALKDAKTVQEAIDRLCKLGHGNGCEVVVGRGGTFNKLDEAIEELLEKRKQTDLCICLLPGDHVLGGGLRIKGSVGRPVIHLKIVGCNLGSRLILQEPLTAQLLRSFTLRDVQVKLTRGRTALQFDQCEEVTVESCWLLGLAQADITSLVTIRDAIRITLTDNVVEAYHKDSADVPAKVFGGIDLLQPLFERISDRDQFHGQAVPAAIRLAGLDPTERKKLAGQITGLLAQVRMTDGEKTTYARLTAALVAERPSPQELAGLLRAVREAALRATPGTALVLASPAARTTLTRNNILGVLSLYGAPDGKDLNRDEMALLAKKLKGGEVSIAESSGTLQATDNHFTRLVVSEDVINRLRELALGTAKGEIVGPYRTGFFTANVFEAERNHWVARHLSLTANAFHPLTKADVGVAVAEFATYVGNQGTGDFRLFNVSRVSLNQKAVPPPPAPGVQAGNLGINIVDT